MSEASAPAVLYREEGDLAFITLNRPEKLNALNPEVFGLLGRHIDRFLSGDCKVAILHGNGRAFAAGADVEGYVDLSVVAYADFMRFGNGVQQQLIDCPKPIIASVHGYALGGGLELALACDLIIVDPAAKLGLPEAKLGLLPGGGGTQRLPRIIGIVRAADLLMTARMITGAEAVSWGLALDMGDAESPLEAARSKASRIASMAPVAVRMAKVLLHGGAEAPLSAGLPLEQAVGAMLYATDDAREGVSAFVEKRPANFIGR